MFNPGVNNVVRLLLRIAIATAFSWMLLPLENSASAPVSLFQLAPLRIDLDSETEYQTLEDRRLGGTFESSHWTTAQGLTFRRFGSVYHPELFVFKSRARFAWQQFTGSSNTGFDRISRRGRLDVYRLDGNLFQNKSFSFRLSAGRTKNRVRGTRVLGREDHRNDITLAASWKKTAFPVSITWQRLRNNRGGTNPLRDQRYISNILVSRTAGNNRLWMNYSRSRFEVLGRSLKVGTQQLDASFSRTPRNALRLRSSLNWLRQDYGRGFETIRGNTHFSRDLPRNFKMSLNTAMRHTQFAEQSSSTWDVSLSSSHRLYKSLNTSIRQKWSGSNLDNGTLQTTNSAFDLNYHKTNLLGIFGYRFGFEHLYQKSDLDQSSLLVRENSFVFPPDDRLLLSDPGIIQSSIVVKDSSATEIFALGTDYNIENQGRYVVLIRISGGRIYRDTTVLVSYQETISKSGKGGRETLTNELSWRFPYGLSVRKLRSRTYPFQDTSAFTFGATRGYRNRYNIDWSARYAHVGWYREEALRDDLFTLDQRFQINAQTRTKLLGALSGQLALGASRIGHDSDDVATTSLSWSATRSINQRMELQLRGSLTRRDVREGRQLSHGLDCRFRWALRATLLDFEWHLRNNDTPLLGEQKEQMFSLLLQRKLR